MYRVTSITLLSGADITISYDREEKKFSAKVIVGFSSKSAIADDPVTAIGLAAIMQAGMTKTS